MKEWGFQQDHFLIKELLREGNGCSMGRSSSAGVSLGSRWSRLRNMEAWKLGA